MTHEIIPIVNYSFPAAKWARTAKLKEQLNHVRSEIKEIDKEVFGTNGHLEEMIDLYHSLETFFRILERDGADVAGAFCKVYKKNKARGYYENLDTQTAEPETNAKD
jgi:hypothetical protein